MMLETINQPNDIKKLSASELDLLAQEIREFLIETISQTGGHLASNLGVVELTMALHLALTFPEDKLVWDVGHQSYTHKLLTGRRESFGQLRKYGGISGFPKRKESNCDSFDTGHSSTSISAGLGYAQAREILGGKNMVVSVIGDGALTGGMAFEALNNASRLKSNFIIVLNDNNMSISENVGGLSRHLGNLRTADAYRDLKTGVTNSLSRIPRYGERMVEQIRRTKSGIKQLFIPGMLFENMGVTYLGPIDGHNIDMMVKTFREAAKVDGAVLVHVMTQKGKGYPPAERHPSRFHGTDAFEIDTGLPAKKRVKANYTDVFSTVMRKMGDRDEKVVAITAAMADGTGLKRFRNMFPERFFDVGIAEEHAVTFAAGLAAGGLKPVFADINDTLCLDPGSVRERITDRTRAVAFVGIGGNTGDIKEVSQICKEKGLKLVLDAAHMSGTKMKGESLEKLADISIYSFQSTKVLLTADGGMVCCHEKELEKRIRTKAFVGLDKTRTPWSEKNTQRWYYDITDLGGSYLGNDIMAAIGLAQYRHLDSDIELRHKIANSYKEKLSGCDKVRFIRVPGDCYSAQWLFQIVVPKRDALMEYLESKEIFAGLHYLDNTQFRHYCYAEGTCPNADYYSRHMVSLPFHLRLTEEDISRVAENIIEFCEDYRSDKT